MKFRIKDLEKYLNQKLNWENVAKELTLKSFESVYKKGILEVDILPNRYADAASVVGILTELKNIGQIKNFKEPKINFSIKKNRVSELNINVINQIKNFCPYYFGKVIVNIKNKKSHKWLEEFVKFYGFNSINFLVDLTNFVMIEYGAPLHVFDLDKIKGNIYVRLAKKGEKFISLDDKEYTLQGDEIVIADKEKILALAGIKGGKLAEVSFETKNIFIEAAVFDPQKIYETSKKFNLKTESSFRFERKISPYRSFLALQRICFLIEKNLQGESRNDIIGYKKLIPKEIYFNFNKINQISGLSLSKNEVLKILNLLNIKYIPSQNKIIIPLDRMDLNSEEDIIEEIIRIYGWNKIKSQMEIITKDIFVDEKIKFNNYLRLLLTKCGYNEAYNYNFYGDKEKEFVNKIFKHKISHIEVLNPLSDNYKYFQVSLLPNLIKDIYFNQFSFKEIRLFRIEKIGFLDKNRTIEKYKCCIIFAEKNSEQILKELKGVLRKIFEELNIDFYIQKNNNLLGDVLVNRNKIGLIGLLSKDLIDNFNIDLKVGFIELEIDNLIRFKKAKRYIPLALYPSINRDLSFFVNEKVTFSEIKKEILGLKIDFLENITLIDIYFFKDKQQQKSITLKLIFRHPHRTLNESEIEESLNLIKNLLLKKFQVEFR